MLIYRWSFQLSAVSSFIVNAFHRKMNADYKNQKCGFKTKTGKNILTG
jgi:hypothetical protein